MHHDRTKSAPRPLRSTVSVAIIGIIAAGGLSIGYQALQAPARQVENAQPLLGSRPGPPTMIASGQSGAPGRIQADLRDDLTDLDSREPTVANLDPRLLRALRRASTDAARGAVTITINSGWRSRRHQQQLLDQAVAEYGSADEAARWVATVKTSPHVVGDAVDLGPARAISWLTEHGVDYGLCQIYDNEPWHFELRPAAVARGCPPRYSDPTRDPRMQR